MDVLAPEDFEKMMEIPKVQVPIHFLEQVGLHSPFPSIQPKGERKRNAFKLLTSELSDGMKTFRNSN